MPPKSHDVLREFIAEWSAQRDKASLPSDELLRAYVKGEVAEQDAGAVREAILSSARALPRLIDIESETHLHNDLGVSLAFDIVELDGLAPGAEEQPGLAAETLREDGARVESWEIDGVSLVLALSGTNELRAVVTRNDAALVGAKVALYMLGPGGQSSRRAAGVTDSKGEVELGNVRFLARPSFGWRYLATVSA